MGEFLEHQGNSRERRKTGVTRSSKVGAVSRTVPRTKGRTWPSSTRRSSRTAYARLLEHPDPLVRARAANNWCAWEDAVVSLEPNGRPNAYSDRPPAAVLALVRICAHYFSHGAWLEEGALLRDAHRLAGIPGVLIHGRLDLSGPLRTAWELARAWPDATLFAISDSGHQGSATMRDRMLSALDEFAR
jgi:proline iminopeptidase